MKSEYSDRRYVYPKKKSKRLTDCADISYMIPIPSVAEMEKNQNAGKIFPTRQKNLTKQKVNKLKTSLAKTISITH